MFAGIDGSVRLFQITCLVVLLSVVLHGGGIAVFLAASRRRAGRDGRCREGSTPRAERTAFGATEPSAPSRWPRRRARVESPERITIPELRRLWEQGEPVTVLDVRTERSYRDDPQIATGAIRMPPDDAVRLARERGLDQHGTLVLYCT